MGSRRYLWQLFGFFTLLIVLCTGVIGGIIFHYFQSFYRRHQLESVAQVIAATLNLDQIENGVLESDLRSLTTDFPSLSQIKAIVLSPEGIQLSSAGSAPSQVDFREYPEVSRAIDGLIAHERRADMSFLAYPLMDNGKLRGVLRISRPDAAFARDLADVRNKLWGIIILAALFASALSFHFTRRFGKPIEAIRAMAERYSEGDFSQRLNIDYAPEFAGLAQTMNMMAGRLNEQFIEITHRRNELEAILHSMKEGVLAIDRDERFMIINPAAESILGLSGTQMVGRKVKKVMRKAELRRFIRRTLRGKTIDEKDKLLTWGEDRLLRIESAPLNGSDNEERGLLVVFNDVTYLNQLENLRREFVSNVSHELRTPITSIKGFIETLLDGALTDEENARRFLNIIARQTDRLSNIVEDLLTLSRVERGEERSEIELTPQPLKSILETVIQNYQEHPRANAIGLVLNCPPEICVRANSQLLEQAVTNLIENALKYSQSPSPIQITAASIKTDPLAAATEEADDHRNDPSDEQLEDAQPSTTRVLIKIEDQGVGIPDQYLSRIFERFYRADTARSREMGGTGLGLAIVKHIAQAHGGRVHVKSQVGQGSTFTIELPGIEEQRLTSRIIDIGHQAAG